MANVLKMATVHSILTLHERGWSQRRIARELGVHRETVRRYVLRAAQGDPADGGGGANQPPPGHPPAGSTGQNRPNPPTGSAAPNRPFRGRSHPPAGSSGPASRCEPWRRQIVAGLERGLSAQRIWQDLRDDHGFAGGYDSVKRYCRRLRSASPLPYRRMSGEPGAEAQVDFGTGARVLDGCQGEKNFRGRRTHVFRIVLSHSRKAYSESVYRQTTEEFIRCLENAFRHFGGVPGTLVLDNLKAAVTKADWFDPEINPKMQSFCAHYGIVPLPTKPRMPRHKGKVERGVAYVQDNALKGRTFTSLAEQNAHLLHWEATVADTRIHGTTRRQVQQVFDEVERAALQPLAPERFPCFEEGSRMVNRDGHVEVAKAYYSAPPEYLGRRVWARWDGHLVRLFDARMKPIAVHPRKEAGRFSTQDRHIVSEKVNGVEHGAAKLLLKTELIGTHANRWSRAMVKTRGIQGVRVLQGLLSLANRHPHERIDRACEIALSHGALRLRTIRTLIRRDVDAAAAQRPLPIAGAEFIDAHPIIRDLADYGELVHNALTLQGAST